MKTTLLHLSWLLVCAALLTACGGNTPQAKSKTAQPLVELAKPMPGMAMPSGARPPASTIRQEQFNTEQYDVIKDNNFKETLANPQSTFTIDVDTASYSNVRRFLNERTMPPTDAVRIEELINYFSYTYSEPKGKEPLAVETEMSECPWQPEHKLIRIGLKGKHVDASNIPSSNLVFLLDVSGSMNAENKLPLLKDAFGLLVKQLRPQDRVSIVVYAGAAGLVLPATSGDKKAEILASLSKLEAGGSTAGSAGIKLAYEVAKEQLIKNGNNRVIIATDGDFNVGASSDGDLVRLIEDKRQEGIFLTVLGFGMGNYKDSKMEKLADSGNGNYAYIDNLLEAKKVMVKEFASTMLTVAKDVKLQIEFNPAKVKAYRLIGYENRMLNAEDFANDKKDAGELGADQSVTALYEIIPAISEGTTIKNLKYVKNVVDPKAKTSAEIMTIHVRFKSPTEDTSKPMSVPIRENYKTLSATSQDFRFASAVAEFGLLLRKSEFKGNASYARVLDRAQNARGADEEGYRAEFIKLVETTEILSSK